jgi:Flp pilus assembly protein TadB
MEAWTAGYRIGRLFRKRVADDGEFRQQPAARWRDTARTSLRPAPIKPKRRSGFGIDWRGFFSFVFLSLVILGAVFGVVYVILHFIVK